MESKTASELRIGYLMSRSPESMTIPDLMELRNLAVKLSGKRIKLTFDDCGTTWIDLDLGSEIRGDGISKIVEKLRELANQPLPEKCCGRCVYREHSGDALAECKCDVPRPFLDSSSVIYVKLSDGQECPCFTSIKTQDPVSVVSSAIDPSVQFQDPNHPFLWTQRLGFSSVREPNIYWLWNHSQSYPIASEAIVVRFDREPRGEWFHFISERDQKFTVETGHKCYGTTISPQPESFEQAKKIVESIMRPEKPNYISMQLEVQTDEQFVKMMHPGATLRIGHSVHVPEIGFSSLWCESPNDAWKTLADWIKKAASSTLPRKAGS